MIERWSIDRCKKIRKLLDCSQEDIAKIIEVKKQTISNWESGKLSINIPQQEILYTLALKDILEERGITLEELVQKQIEELEGL